MVRSRTQTKEGSFSLFICHSEKPELCYVRLSVGQSDLVSNLTQDTRHICFCVTVAAVSILGTLCEGGGGLGLSFKLLMVLDRAAILDSEPRGAHDHILLRPIRDSPNLEGQAPIYFPHRNRVALL
jgi:hypothetical protein